MESTVVRILEEDAKHGISTKTGKPWSMSRVELENGEGVFIFNPIDVGNKVTKQQNGEYENWVKIKPDPKHDEIMEALRKIYALLKETR